MCVRVHMLYVGMCVYIICMHYMYIYILCYTIYVYILSKIAYLHARDCVHTWRVGSGGCGGRKGAPCRHPVLYFGDPECLCVYSGWGSGGVVMIA